MNCEGCINTHKCYDCHSQNMYVGEIVLGKHEPSEWELRWITWAKEEVNRVKGKENSRCTGAVRKF